MIKNLLIIFLIFQFISFINCTITFRFDDANQSPLNNNFTFYPQQTKNGYCYININFWVIQEDGNGTMSILLNSTSDSSNILGKNTTHFYYSLNAYSKAPDTSYSILVNATGGENNETNSFVVNYYCSYYNLNEFDFQQVSNIYYDLMYGQAIVFEVVGKIPGPISQYVYIDEIYVPCYQLDKNHYLLLMYFYYNVFSSHLSGDLIISFAFDNGFKNYTVSNYYDGNFVDNINTNWYSTNTNDTIQLIGANYLPLFTFQTPIQPNVAFPFYMMSSPSYYDPTSGMNLYSKLISQNNNTLTYINTIYNGYLYGILDPLNISIYQQNKSGKSMAWNQVYHMKSIQTSIFSTSQTQFELVDGETSPSLLNINIYTGSTFYLTNFRLGLNYITTDLQAPFGFQSNFGIDAGDNSNFMFNITVPISSHKSIPTVLIQTNYIYPTLAINNDYVAPSITSFEYQYITNKQYLLKITLSSPVCGFGYISYVDNTDYYRLSQFLVSGDQFNGSYEIIYDSDIELGFNSLYFNDLCGNRLQLSNGDYISTIPFKKFVVPFKTFNFSIYDITDISFKYNNIDCSRQSVANTIYFTHPTIDISKAPIAFRYPEFNNVNQNGYFVKEFYGFWNSSINKYQIDFVIPKNSPIGNLQYVLAIDTINFVTSDVLSKNVQLIITKSNLDAMGPTFTYIEKLVFENNQFGWKLNISDPINGFDNGTITVMGSMDNSIYKFDLLPSNMIAGDIYQGTWEIIIQVDSRSCVNQNYSITFVKLYDTGAQFSVFELTPPTPNQSPNQLTNPFYLFFNDSTINKYEITCNNPDKDLTPPFIASFTSSVSTIDVGAVNRNITFTLEVYDDESGINIFANGPIIYLIGESLEVVKCVSVLQSNTTSNANYYCTVEVPIGFASTLGVFTVSVYGIINNHGLYNGYSSEMLKSYSLTYKIPVTFTSNAPLLLNSGRASSKGGLFFIYGRVLSDVQKVTITDIITNQSKDYTTIDHYGSNVISIPNLNAIEHKFKVTVTSKSGITSNSILVSPYLFLDFVPYSDSSDSGPSTPIPTNAPQKCTGNPVCGGPSKGYCNITTGCICIYPYYGKDCLSEIIDTKPPVVDPNEPSTSIEIPNNNSTDNNGNQVDIVHYKSLVSIVSLREININGNIVKNYQFNKNWVSTELSSLKTLYLTNVTDSNNNLITTVSATLEWFNQSKTINFADQDIKMNPNSIKYTINISEYPFMNSLNSLQLVMSATFESNSSYSCSSKDYGDTSTGDNSNYIKIQVDNKSLYGRFIKRGIVDDNKIVSLSNQLLDSSLNAISSPSQSQSYIGITIPKYNKNCIIDPDFSVLLDSNSASSNSNSVCESSGGLSGSKIAGIVIGSVAFVAVIVVSVAYYFKRKNDDKKLKTNIEKKLSQMN